MNWFVLVVSCAACAPTKPAAPPATPPPEPASAPVDAPSAEPPVRSVHYSSPDGAYTAEFAGTPHDSSKRSQDKVGQIDQTTTSFREGPLGQMIIATRLTGVGRSFCKVGPPDAPSAALRSMRCKVDAHHPRASGGIESHVQEFHCDGGERGFAVTYCDASRIAAERVANEYTVVGLYSDDAAREAASAFVDSFSLTTGVSGR